MNDIIKETLKNTLFLAKTLDFFEGFFNPGKDYNIIACQSSEELIQKNPEVYVEEVSRGKRLYSTSLVFMEIMHNSKEFQKYVNTKYIWTYQAYSWTNDLKCCGKTVFAIDYYLFLKLQNKLSQKKLLLEYSAFSGKKELKNNLENTSIKLKTKVFPKRQLSYEDLFGFYNGEFVVYDSTSNGGEGVYRISKHDEYLEAITSIKNPVIRTELFLHYAIPVNQIGFVMFDGTIVKYKPSIQIIQNIHQHNKMEYAGCDFTSEKYFEKPDIIFDQITKLTHEVGEILYKVGYRGTFGIDYLVKGEEVYFTELNPRYQASTLIPNIHLSNEELFTPHILHILGFIETPSSKIKKLLDKYRAGNVFIDFIQVNKPIGFINIYDDAMDNLRSPGTSIEIEKGLNKGYYLYYKPIIKVPFYPTKCSL